MNPAETLSAALAHHQAGRLAEAETGYRQILALDPQNPAALHLLGVVAHQTGHQAPAIELIQEAIKLEPQVAEYHNNLGRPLECVDRFADAEACYRRAIALKPDYAEAFNNLGNALRKQRQPTEALTAYAEAIRLRPRFADPHVNRAAVFLDQKRSADAIAAARDALQIDPALPEAHNALGNAFKAQQNLSAAMEAYRVAIALNPRFPEAHNNAGTILFAWHRDEEALAEFNAALTCNPGYVEALLNQSSVLQRLDRPDEALAACQRALAFKPRMGAAHNDLGVILLNLGRIEEALAAFDRAIETQPDCAEAFNNRALALKKQGRFEESIAAWRAALQHDPDFTVAHSALLFELLCQPEARPAEIFAEHRRWNSAHAARFQAEWRPHSNLPDPARRLRIGYVSSDLRDHAVGRNVHPLLQHHDRRRFEIVAYANVHKPDRWSDRLRAHCDAWHDITTMTDAEVAARVRADAIDILVDLNVHTTHHRLLVFARKPAPVQVTFAGYPGTTGMDAMDYRLTDFHLDPAGERDTFYTERSIRLPHCFWCFDPLDERPEPAMRPPPDRTPFQWGCLNNPYKIKEPQLELWARVLRATPESRLLCLAANEFDVARITESLTRQEIAAERLEFVGLQSRLRYLVTYGRCDAILDTFPYGGHTTTCDALWMGVPVVSLVGETAVTRGGLSLLSNIGLPELAAGSADEFVHTAVALTQDRTRLATLHHSLRQRMESSPLMDGPGFARDIEAAFREMWSAWCRGRSAILDRASRH